MHAPLPLQAPLQPLKVESESGVAVKVTDVPVGKSAEQVAPQLIPAGLLVTVPLPPPALVTVSLKAVEKVAVTDLLAFMTTVHVAAVLIQSPLQPVKTELVAASALRVTVVPLVKDAEQVAPQLIPAGVLVTVPLPVPDLLAMSVKVGRAEKVTVTERLLVIATVHCLLSVETESQPLQLSIVEAESGVAVNVTVAFMGKDATHVVPQLIPAGLLVIVPLPVPALFTVSVNVSWLTPPIEHNKIQSAANPMSIPNFF